MLWTLDEIERVDPARAEQLRTSPAWSELIRGTCLALRAAIAAGDARFGFDESSSDPRDLRTNIQFKLETVLFDRLFNGLEGYRAQFRIGRENGLIENARFVSELCDELRRSAPSQVCARLLTHDFKDKGSMVCTIDQVLRSMDPPISKIWVCERLIGNSGEIQELFVSRTGPKLTFLDSEPWSSFFPEDGAGWLDVKGAFVSPTGLYQLKPPRERAARLEERGSA